ncbi:MAG: sulfate adenylyltransferase [Candidatus Omnitrophica bacterium]|nr:sulfate adenylyltransferase [Candidatus Omnitrophota bacterium]
MAGTGSLIAPHGGRLVERLVKGHERESLLHHARGLRPIVLDEWELSDVELLGLGAVSPLEGFLGQADYDSVVDRMQLADGTVWAIPLTLSLTKEEADGWREGSDLALTSPEGQVVAVLHEPQLYPHNKAVEAKLVYGTNDESHPAVARLMAQGPFYVGGKVSVLNLPAHDDFLPFRLTPAETRQEFSRRGWRSVVGFQTRNPIHRAHEYLLRCALEIADGLLIHPLVGQTKSDDLSAAVRMRCYQALIDGYFPRDRVMLVVNPAAMRYAGPREAVFHAIIRQNYGCSHFIVGRDHAGVGKFYGTFDAQILIQRFTREELAVTPLCFDNSFFCRVCQGMASSKTCAHPAPERVSLSGTAVRQMLSEGKAPPPEFTRPEIAEILKEAYAGPAGARL